MEREIHTSVSKIINISELSAVQTYNIYLADFFAASSLIASIFEEEKSMGLNKVLEEYFPFVEIINKIITYGSVGIVALSIANHIASGDYLREW